MFFKVNLPAEDSKGGESHPPARRESARKSLANPIWSRLEIAISVILLLAWGGWWPGVNETHYLVKARGFWDPAFCPGDLFVHAPASHWFFYLVFGWLTTILSLPMSALVGRIGVAILFSLAWAKMTRHIIALPGFAFMSLALFLLLNSRFHLAGEWVIGGVESKSFAYILLLLALDAMIRQRWGQVWCWVGCASAFHVLVGGWAGVAFAVARLMAMCFELPARRRVESTGRVSSPQIDRISLRKEGAWLAMGILISLIGVLPPLLTNLSGDGNLTAAASQIYVKERIGHHLDFAQFPTERVAEFALLLSCWLVATRVFPTLPGIRRIHWFCGGALLIGLAGLLLSSAASGVGESRSSWATTLLRLYWFRLGDFALPLACSIQLTSLAFWSLLRFRHVSASRVLFGASTILIAIAVSISLIETYRPQIPSADFRTLPKYDSLEKDRRAYRNWIRVCEWIRANTPPDARFITPTQQQSFKWYSHRTEFVNWKDIPQQNNSILEWKRRIDRVSRPQQAYEAGLLAFDDRQLKMLADEFGIDYLLVLQKEADLIGNSTKLERVYPASADQRTTYAVFRLR